MGFGSDNENQARPEELEELLDSLETLFDRTRVLYEQYFLGLHKEVPIDLHRDFETRLRGLTDQYDGNASFPFRLTALCRKFEAYNAYWKQSLRGMEQGKSAAERSAAEQIADQLSDDDPSRALTVNMPKLVRDQILHDQALLAAERAETHQDERSAELAAHDALMHAAEIPPRRRPWESEPYAQLEAKADGEDPSADEDEKAPLADREASTAVDGAAQAAPAGKVETAAADDAQAADEDAKSRWGARDAKAATSPSESGLPHRPNTRPTSATSPSESSFPHRDFSDAAKSAFEPPSEAHGRRPDTGDEREPLFSEEDLDLDALFAAIMIPEPVNAVEATVSSGWSSEPIADLAARAPLSAPSAPKGGFAPTAASAHLATAPGRLSPASAVRGSGHNAALPPLSAVAPAAIPALTDPIDGTAAPFVASIPDFGLNEPPPPLDPFANPAAPAAANGAAAEPIATEPLSGPVPSLGLPDAKEAPGQAATPTTPLASTARFPAMGGAQALSLASPRPPALAEPAPLPPRPTVTERRSTASPAPLGPAPAPGMRRDAHVTAMPTPQHGTPKRPVAADAGFRVPPPPGASQASAATAPARAEPAPMPGPTIRPPAKSPPAHIIESRTYITPSRPALPLAPAFPPAPPLPPGMNEKQCRDLYTRYVRARKVLGETDDDITYAKLVSSLGRQAAALMTEKGVRGVEFHVVVRGDKVLLKAVPLKSDK